MERAQDAVFADPRCPQAALALRPLAIKHHLMVIVSLAFIQGETRLGQECVRRLVHMDPSVVEGSPCELLSFLLMESVADESLDHAEALRDILAQLPPELGWLSARYAWSVAQGYLWKGVRAVLWDRTADGAAHFAQARLLHAEIDGEFIGFVTQHLLNYAHEFGGAAAESAIDNLAPHFTQVAGRRSVHLLKGRYQANRAFEQYRSGEYSGVPGAVLRSMANEPARMTNRGLLSILARSIANMSLQPVALRTRS